jgi:uncharacterized protein
VHHPKRPFRINVGFLINQAIGYSRDFPFEDGDFFISPDLILRKLTGTAVLSRTQPGLHVNADFQASIMVNCVRCLEDYELPLHAVFEEIFTFETHPLSENGQIIPGNGYIDLEPFIRDYLLLQIPIKSLCKQNCKGLCAICGQNLNQATCEHHKEAIESSLI